MIMSHYTFEMTTTTQLDFMFQNLVNFEFLEKTVITYGEFYKSRYYGKVGTVI